jgi:hypothetical protein
MWDRVTFTDEEFHYAARLLKRPTSEVAPFVTQRWDELTAPTARTKTFLAEMGIAALPTI